jgi:hypothetical protein
MNLKDALLREYSRAQMLRITDYIGEDPKRFRELLTLFIGDNYRITQRAAWPLSHCVEKHPHLLDKYLTTLLDQLEKPHHNAVTRNIIRLLQFADIPDNEAGRVMNLCFDRLMQAGEPVANKAFSLTVLANLAKRYPEIKNEILLCIETQLPNASPGFRARAKQVRRQLEKTVG